MKIEEAIKRYLDYLEIEKGKSIKTRRNYQYYLSVFKNFLEGLKKTEVSIEDIDLESIRLFRLFLNRKKIDGQKRTLSKKTQSYYLIALRNFLKYLIRYNYKVLSPEKIELPKIEPREIKVISWEELERLLSAPKGNSLKELRDRAILEMLFSTGLRVSELTNLKRKDINLKADEFTVRGKGSKIRIVFLSSVAKQALAKYLKKRQDSEEHLFVSLPKKNRVTPLTSRSIQRIVSYWARRAGIVKPVTPHTLRHMFATDLLQNGADLRAIQELLGHSQITTTQVYTHLSNQALKEVYQAFHARRRKKFNNI